MKVDVEAYQTHWHPEEICEGFPDTPETFFVLGWYASAPRLARRAACWMWPAAMRGTSHG